ncbi:hypothetical protein [Krasilnikovia sp. MM14-A1259]|uniref:hypothetical protein n=1 Tax=Krasilnikovia sp. MM14-A1259 TaxID=3373539 RepID=UPI003808E950
MDSSAPTGPGPGEPAPTSTVERPAEVAADTAAAAGRSDGGAADDEGPRIIAAPPKPRRIVVLLGGALALALLVGSAVVLAALTSNTEPDLPPIAVGPGDPPASPATATAAAPTTTPATPSATASPSATTAPARAARLELLDSTTSLRIRAGDTGRDLVRVRGGQARTDATGTAVRLAPDPGVAAVEVTLNAEVRWTVRTTSGITEGVLDLSAARVSAVDLAGGAARVELTLPRPNGTLPIRIGAGVNELRVHAPAAVPLRIRAGGGANRIVIDGRTVDGVPRGEAVSTTDFAAAGNRVDIDAAAGLGTVTVDRAG